MRSPWTDPPPSTQPPTGNCIEPPKASTPACCPPTPLPARLRPERLCFFQQTRPPLFVFSTVHHFKGGECDVTVLAEDIDVERAHVHGGDVGDGRALLVRPHCGGGGCHVKGVPRECQNSTRRSQAFDAMCQRLGAAAMRAAALEPFIEAPRARLHPALA